MSQRQVSGTAIVPATPSRIFALLTDPASHPLLDGSGSVRASRSREPQQLELGSRFGMDMKLGMPYRIVNTVVEFDADRLIAWRHAMGHRWRWQLAPAGDDHTEVTETFDWSTAHVPWLLSASPIPRKNRDAIDSSLQRLISLVSADR